MSDRDWTRRDFLNQAAAFAATLAAANVVAAQAKPASPKAAGGKGAKKDKPAPTAATTQTKYSQINLAVIGVGGRGHGNIDALTAAGATIVGLCDTDGDALGKAAANFPAAKTCSDFRTMLESQKDIDAVLIATPDHTHAPAAMMAMRMGKHVYCEKPLTYDIYEARTLTEAARKYNVSTQMGNQGMASEGSRQQVEWIRSGVVGPIKEVHVYTDRPVWPQGIDRPPETPEVPKTMNWDAWLGPAPYRPFNPAYAPFKWRGFKDFGTGALGDMACHIMNTSYWALNLSNPSSVEAFSDGGTCETYPTWSIIRYEFPQLGDRPPVKLFWYDGKLQPRYSVVNNKYPSDNGIIWVGEKGSIAAPYNETPYIVDEKQNRDFKPPSPFIPRSPGHHVEWLDAILGGPPASSAFDYSGPLTEVVLLGNLAIRTGKKVEWDYKNLRVTNNRDAQQYVKREYRKGWEL